MMIFCFKQKTAYEMRISDWSSDVCSSDLLSFRYREGAGDAPLGTALHRIAVRPARRAAPVDRRAPAVEVDHQPPAAQIVAALAQIGRASCRERVCQYV